LFGIGLAVASFAFAACGGHGSSPTPTTTASAVPTPTGSAPASLESPCASSLGVAYEPDGGNGNGLDGIQVVHFEDDSRNLCGAVTPKSTAAAIRLDDPVGPLALSQDGTDAIALLFNSATNGFSLAQDIFGANVGSLVPAGTAYNLSLPPTPVPAVSGSPTPVPASTPTAAVLDDASSITIIGEGTLGVGLVVGPNATPQAIIGLTSIGNAPPQYGSSVPFIGSTNTLTHPFGTSFTSIRSITDSANVTNVLVRGTNDLIAIGVTGVASGYQFNIESEDKNLGSNVVLRGYGHMALNPADSSRALVGGTSAGNANQLTLVTGLPTSITESSTLQMPGAINSIVFGPFGTYAAIGTTAGIVIVGGTTGNTLGEVKAFGPTVTGYAPTFTNCNGTTSTLTNVASVGFSADENYLVALGTASGVSCASGYNATLVAVHFNSGTGATPAPNTLPTPTAAPSGSPSPSPIPTFFQQNNIIPPPANADYLYVH